MEKLRAEPGSKARGEEHDPGRTGERVPEEPGAERAAARLWSRRPSGALLVQRRAGNRALLALRSTNRQSGPSVQRNGNGDGDADGAEEQAAAPDQSAWIRVIEGAEFEVRGREFEVFVDVRPRQAAAVAEATQEQPGTELGAEDVTATGSVGPTRTTRLHARRVGRPSQLLESAVTALQAQGAVQAGPLTVSMDVSVLEAQLRSDRDFDVTPLEIGLNVSGVLGSADEARQLLGVELDREDVTLEVQGRVATKIGVDESRALQRYLRNMDQLEDSARQLSEVDRQRAGARRRLTELDGRESHLRGQVGQLDDELDEVLQERRRIRDIPDVEERLDRWGESNRRMREVHARRREARRGIREVATERRTLRRQAEALDGQATRLQRRLGELGLEADRAARDLEDSPVARKLKRRLARRATRRLGQLLLKVIPFVNVVSTIYDAAETARMLYALATGRAKFGLGGGAEEMPEEAPEEGAGVEDGATEGVAGEGTEERELPEGATHHPEGSPEGTAEGTSDTDSQGGEGGPGGTSNTPTGGTEDTRAEGTGADTVGAEGTGAEGAGSETTGAEGAGESGTEAAGGESTGEVEQAGGQVPDETGQAAGSGEPVDLKHAARLVVEALLAAEGVELGPDQLRRLNEGLPDDLTAEDVTALADLTRAEDEVGPDETVERILAHVEHQRSQPAEDEGESEGGTGAVPGEGDGEATSEGEGSETDGGQTDGGEPATEEEAASGASDEGTVRAENTDGAAAPETEEPPSTTIFPATSVMPVRWDSDTGQFQLTPDYSSALRSGEFTGTRRDGVGLRWTDVQLLNQRREQIGDDDYVMFTLEVTAEATSVPAEVQDVTVGGELREQRHFWYRPDTEEGGRLTGAAHVNQALRSAVEVQNEQLELRPGIDEIDLGMATVRVTRLADRQRLASRRRVLYRATVVVDVVSADETAGLQTGGGEWIELVEGEPARLPVGIVETMQGAAAR